MEIILVCNESYDEIMVFINKESITHDCENRQPPRGAAGTLTEARAMLVPTKRSNGEQGGSGESIQDPENETGANLQERKWCRRN